MKFSENLKNEKVKISWKPLTYKKKKLKIVNIHIWLVLELIFSFYNNVYFLNKNNFKT